ncbi:hypothetical protein CHUAL_000963 [Chamberlinius hualienensis]
MKTAGFFLLSMRYYKSGVNFRRPLLKSLAVQDVVKSFTRNLHNNSASSVVPSSDSKPDLLLEKLQEASSINEIVNLIQVNKTAVTAAHCSRALQHIVKNLRNETVTRSDLTILCNVLTRKARFLNLHEILSVTSDLERLKVSPKTIVMQTVLQHLRCEINSLSFKDVFFLEGLFKKMTETPLITSLRTSLPLVVKNHLEMQMNREDIRELTKLFRFGAYHKFEHLELKKISTAILEYTSEWSVLDACAIFWGLTSLPREELKFYPQLVMKAMKEFSQNVNQVSSQEFLQLLHHLHSRNILSVVLFKLAVRRAVAEKWDLDCLHALAKLASEKLFFNLSLFNSYEMMVEEYIANGREMSFTMFEFIDILAKINYSPHNLKLLWDEAKVQLQREQHAKAAADLILNLITLGQDCDIVNYSIFQKYDLVSYLTQQGRFKNFCIKNSLPKLTSIFAGLSVKSIKKAAILLNLMGKWDQLPNELRKEWLEKLAETQLSQSENLGFPLKKALNMGLSGFRVYDSLLTTSGIYIGKIIKNKAIKMKYCSLKTEEMGRD